ncbi:DUF1674 domain-containing protein [Methylocystis sp. MJC1]|jgi:hypothetical protein|uniref:DUF1674 domain-containing protein n=1 Tax=Methylocystis sp. MJC1 TaxID=2654282 RepID=UPI0013EA6CE8|nr:DUF1674 domain-containing protein [Methylocystis sp. MJC1]KAF2989799.1 hypothetical protein MJC1_03144 [Methylocystis sp. MJC1]MBU6526314.1 DUF1674 domain-containing protein [Methylocystis sp. MJC1]UZX12766.1 DUF1674 domain-containing protein [Methylocystis sp. MJC1]
MSQAKGTGGDVKPAQAIKDMPPAAQRALAEAQARENAAATEAAAREERGGRGGLDPARYGDWEVKGVASDF